ncbi:MAG TPA: Hsp20/alpha crystallin family protein [Cyclobacteriaceae bacterium]|nr:Hsp20/alpha crystallin family protein [Cyclobacteriaceae bacterium]
MSLMLRNVGFPTLFSDWFNSDFMDVDSPIGKRLGVTVPSANFAETDKEYRIELAAPGLKRKDFKVEMDNHTLTVSSEKEEEKEDVGDDYSRKEYSYNSFCRSFSLPENVNEDKVDAKYEDGVLIIHIPKKEVTSKKARKAITVA